MGSWFSTDSKKREPKRTVTINAETSIVMLEDSSTNYVVDSPNGSNLMFENTKDMAKNRQMIDSLVDADIKLKDAKLKRQLTIASHNRREISTSSATRDQNTIIEQ